MCIASCLWSVAGEIRVYPFMLIQEVWMLGQVVTNVVILSSVCVLRARRVPFWM